MSLDFNNTKSTKMLGGQNKPKSYEDDLNKILGNDYNPQERNLNQVIVERYETSEANPEGKVKKIEYIDDKEKVIIVREYHRNGRYQRTVYTPDGKEFKSELYNANGELGKQAGARKKKLKDKKLVGYYTTEELDELVSEFDAKYKHISKSDLINFCIRYTFDNNDEGTLAKHIEDFQDFLEKQGY